MTVYSLPVLAGALFSFTAGCYIYLNNRKSQNNISFSLFCFALFLWLFGYTIAYSIMDEQIALRFCRIACTGAMFTAPAFYHFTISFLSKKNEIKYVALAYILTIMITPLSLTSNLFLSGVYKYYWGYYSKAGFFHPFYLSVFFIIFFRGFYLLFKERRKKEMKHIRKLQIKYVFIAYVVALLGAIDYLPKYGIEIYPFGFMFVILFILIVAYAIIRHKLLDIEVIIKKTLVFAGLFGVSYGVIVSFAYFGSIVFENVVRNRWIAMVPSVFVIVLILRPLEHFLRTITDEYLFQKKYDYRQLLKIFADDVLSVIELKKLISHTVEMLSQIMKLENAAILLYNEKSKKFHTAGMADLVVDSNYAIDGSEKLLVLLDKKHNYILREDSGRVKPLPVDIEKVMNKLQSELVLPLKHRENLIGIVSLGKKKSDEDFTEEDIDMLLTLSRTLSIAITNAQLFVRLAEAQAQDAQKEKMAVIGTLSAGINHEICNPLGIARGQCEMFLLNWADGVYKDRTSEELLEKACEIMHKVIHETDRATVITRKLSSFAKPAKGEIEDNVRIEDEIQQVISLVEHDLVLDNISITTKYQKKLPCISADRKQVQEIFFNIIRNAVQSITDKGKVTINVTSSGKNVFVAITDTGVGIGKEHLSQIFNPFFTTKDPGKGTGLGLFIVKQIIEKNNGSIDVQSEPGKGTTFKLVFKAVGKHEEKEEIGKGEGKKVESGRERVESGRERVGGS